MTTATETMPQTEVMYRTLFLVIDQFEDIGTAFAIIDAMPHGLRQGSCTGKGLSSVTLLCTTGEAATVCHDINVAGVSCRVVGDCEAPHRPHTWGGPVFRDNWPS